jgi:lysophospholipid acyltransferase (LPLAT)-like uncharacterized protein
MLDVFFHNSPMSDATTPIPDPQPPARKSGVVVPHSAKWHQRLAAFLICLGINAVAATVRYRVSDPHGFLVRKDFGQAIYCVWHNRLALCLKIYFAFNRLRRSTRELVGLISASKDGALLSQIFKNFGIQPVRGSSSRRGAQALRELTTWTKRGYDISLTPDGPRGPRYVVADGVIALAQLTGLPVVPVSYHLKWKIQVKSWDGFQIPLPFTRCEVTVGRLMFVPSEASDVEREKLRLDLQSELRAITRD